MVDIIENKSGVGAFIVAPERPDSFLAITELTSKRSSNKLCGMYSPPFETVEDGETHQDALRRVFTEELRIIRGEVPIPKDLESAKLCVVQLSPNVWLHTYLLQASEGTIFRLGDMKHEVGMSFSAKIKDVIESGNDPTSLIYRPASIEIAYSYLKYLRDPQNFQPLIYQKTFHSVPAEIFDRLERQANQNEALSRFVSVP